MTPYIRKAAIEDVNALAPLFNAYRVFYQQAPDIEGAEKFLRERLQNNESVIFLAYVEHEMVGFTQLYPIFSSVSMRRALLLNDLFVNDKARGKGVATSLLASAKQYCIETGGKWLLLQTGCENLPAQALYEKDGWHKETDFFYQFNA